MQSLTATSRPDSLPVFCSQEHNFTNRGFSRDVSYVSAFQFGILAVTEHAQKVCQLSIHAHDTALVTIVAQWTPGRQNEETRSAVTSVKNLYRLLHCLQTMTSLRVGKRVRKARFHCRHNAK